MTGVVPYHELSEEDIEVRYSKGDFPEMKSLGSVGGIIMGCWQGQYDCVDSIVTDMEAIISHVRNHISIQHPPRRTAQNRFRLSVAATTSDPRDDDLTASKQLQTLLRNHIHSCSLRQTMGTALCLYPAETSLRKQYERRTTSQERQKHRTDGIAVSGREQAIEVRVRKEGSRRRAGAAMYLSSPLPIVEWAAISSLPYEI
ncbi:MAG: hypothetical protein M1840_006634 [Geoglossum simile]|nr:MAG: hypothetical protein M1840_006634 [Geoglossum simile]